MDCEEPSYGGVIAVNMPCMIASGRRTAGHADVHRDYIGYATDGGVAFTVDAAGASTFAQCDDQLGLRRRVVGAPQRELHMP